MVFTNGICSQGSGQAPHDLGSQFRDLVDRKQRVVVFGVEKGSKGIREHVGNDWRARSNAEG